MPDPEVGLEKLRTKHEAVSDTSPEATGFTPLGVEASFQSGELHDQIERLRAIAAKHSHRDGSAEGASMSTMAEQALRGIFYDQRYSPIARATAHACLLPFTIGDRNALDSTELFETFIAAQRDLGQRAEAAVALLQPYTPVLTVEQGAPSPHFGLLDGSINIIGDSHPTRTSFLAINVIQPDDRKKWVTADIPFLPSDN
jgi:hypothetical protein